MTDLAIRVLVVEDDVPTRVGIRAILAAEGGIEVVGETGFGAEAMHLVRTLSPDVVVMEVQLPDADGVALTARIVEDALAYERATRVIVLTAFPYEGSAHRARQAGASEVVPKRAPSDFLVTAVRSVGDGASAHAVVEGRLSEFGAKRDTGVALTPREQEVLALMAQGLANAQIAEALFLSVETVRSHVKSIYKKIGARHRAEAVAFAYQRGFVGESG